jgi:hypothetical protein
VLTGVKAASAGNCLHNHPLVVLHKLNATVGEPIVECFTESASSKGGDDCSPEAILPQPVAWSSALTSACQINTIEDSLQKAA